MKGKFPINFFKNKDLSKLKFWGTRAITGLNTFHIEDTLNGVDANFKCIEPKIPAIESGTLKIKCREPFPPLYNCLSHISVLGLCSKCKDNYDLKIDWPNNNSPIFRCFPVNNTCNSDEYIVNDI
jgi:hypothetical protein